MRPIAAVLGFTLVFSGKAAAVTCPSGSAFELRRPSDNVPLGCVTGSGGGGLLAIPSVEVTYGVTAATMTATAGANFATASGNVGVGTTNPANKLHVKIGTDLNLRFGYPTDSITSMAALNDAGSAYVETRIDGLKLVLNSQSSGNVGIGTAFPGAGLDVSSNVLVNSGMSFGGSAGSLVPMTIRGATGTGFSVLSLDAYKTGSDARLHFTDSASYNFGIGADGATGDFTFRSSNSPSSLGTERMRITQGGYLGIGLDVIPAKLTVRGGTAAGKMISVLSNYPDINGGAYLGFTDETAYNFAIGLSSGDAPGDFVFMAGGNTASVGTERMRVKSGGNVGIGTAGPVQKLHVSGNIGVNAANRIVFDADTSNHTYLYESANDKLAAVVGGTEIATITDTGLGIGTASPGARLDAAPGGYIEGIRTSNAGNSAGIGVAGFNSLFGQKWFVGGTAVAGVASNGGLNSGYASIDPPANGAILSGNVGIGTSAPDTNLHVAGTVKITGGSPGAGKVLTSDSVGLASWTTLAGTGDAVLSATQTFSGANTFTGKNDIAGMDSPYSSATATTVAYSTVAISNTKTCVVRWRLKSANAATPRFRVGNDVTAANYKNTAQGIDETGTGIAGANNGSYADVQLGRNEAVQTTGAGQWNTGQVTIVPTENTTEFNLFGDITHITATPRYERFTLGGTYRGSAYSTLTFFYNSPTTNTHSGTIDVRCNTRW